MTSLASEQVLLSDLRVSVDFQQVGGETVILRGRDWERLRTTAEYHLTHKSIILYMSAGKRGDATPHGGKHHIQY